MSNGRACNRHCRSAAVERMAVQRLGYVGVVADDLAGATQFFVELGLTVLSEGHVEGGWVDPIVGPEGVRAASTTVGTPDGRGWLEQIKFHEPTGPGGDHRAPANTPGIRHIAFEVEDVDGVAARLRARDGELVAEVERYKDVRRICYVRGPEGMIVELAERIG